ncbi:SGNH/GDSL hydrolase family protein [Thalassoglobus sp. JC818]|uniref:SGNH/GDSL hydrolase family protein n=1 Tax=Thalassoglobus sp. JC818 TaxID=3232136 RepID=UPI003458A716
MALLIFTVSIVISELSLRVYIASRGWTTNCFAPQLDLFVPDPVNGATLRNNFRLKSGSFDIRTNQFGLRGPEIEKDAAAETLRIAVLGGSSAFGYFASDGQEAARILEERLQKSIPDGSNFTIEVLNAGVPGYNLFHTLHRFESRVCPLKPDFVLLYLGWNDLTYVVSETPDEQQHQQRTLAPLWERLLGSFVLYDVIAYRIFQRSPQFAPQSGINKQPTDAGVVQFRKNLDLLLNKIEDCEAVPIICIQLMAAHPEADSQLDASLGTTPEDVREVKELGNWLRDELTQVADDRDLMLIDANSSISIDPDHLADAIHPTLTGERKLAEFWKQSIEPIVSQRLEAESASDETDSDQIDAPK